MVKTKRLYILATCFLSGAAAIISLVSLGTQQWVKSKRTYTEENAADDTDYMQIGLFGGTLDQYFASTAKYDLTTVCAFDLNICALLCGDNMVDNLRKLYYRDDENLDNSFQQQCPQVTSSNSARKTVRAGSNEKPERIFINTGAWLCTIIFLIISVIMGLFSAVLAVWNTAANPYQDYFSVFGLYIYNAIACFSLLLAIILYGAMFAKDLSSNIPTYKTFLEENVELTKNSSTLGYSYWINLASLFFYIASIGLLYLRRYLISKEPEVNVHIEDTADPVIYLY